MDPWSQVPLAEGPSTGVGGSSQPEVPSRHGSVNFAPLHQYSQVHSQEDLVRFLRTKLEEKSRRVRDLEAELKDSHSKEQVATDWEDFLLNELAEQVHDLDCKS